MIIQRHADKRLRAAEIQTPLVSVQLGGAVAGDVGICRNGRLDWFQDASGTREPRLGGDV